MEYTIDFTALPINETAYILRRLGMRLLEELLAPPCSPGKALPVKPQPELSSMLTQQDIEILAHSRVWKLKHSYSFKTGRIPKSLREELPRAFKKIIPKSIKGKISLQEWQEAANNRIALALGGTRGDGLPDDLWPVAAESAWSNPEFRFSVALKIHDWLRQMRVLEPYELPLAVLSPMTYWVFIALAGVKPLKFPSWFKKKSRAGIRLCRRLQEEAQNQVMRNEWAGFWDQWIIQLASQRWPSAFCRLKNPLCKALLSLPLLKTTADTTLCQEKKSFKILHRRLVRRLAERWFDIIDGIRRLPRPQSDRRGMVLSNFAVPHWETQMPGFLRY